MLDKLTGELKSSPLEGALMCDFLRCFEEKPKAFANLTRPFGNCRFGRPSIKSGVTFYGIKCSGVVKKSIMRRTTLRVDT